MDLISVIIPFYNHFKYINECIDSFKNQTYKNIEIIIVNDGSDKLEIENVKIINLDKNYGVARARNEGLKIANGNYIGFFGADDIAMPYMLEKSYNVLSKSENKWSIGGLKYIDINGEILKTNPILNQFETIKTMNTNDLMNIVLFGCGFADGSGLYKREIFKTHSFDERLKFGEDRIFWAGLFKNKIFPVYIYDFLYYYRQGSSVTRMPKDRQTEILLKKLIELYRT